MAAIFSLRVPLLVPLLFLLCLLLLLSPSTILALPAPTAATGTAVTLQPLQQYRYSYTALTQPQHAPATLFTGALTLSALSPSLSLASAASPSPAVAILAHAVLTGELSTGDIVGGDGGFQAKAGDLRDPEATQRVMAEGWFFYSLEGEVLKVKVKCDDANADVARTREGKCLGMGMGKKGGGEKRLVLTQNRATKIDIKGKRAQRAR